MVIRRAQFDIDTRYSVDPGLRQITSAEWRVLGFVGTHMTLFEIGERLHISRATVRRHPPWLPGTDRTS